MSTTSFKVPAGAVARVSVIDTTLRLSGMPSSYLLTPSVDGLEKMPTIPTWSFLVEGPTGRRALFDLGVPPTKESFSPAIQKKLSASGWQINSEQHVSEILTDNGIDLLTIEAVIWSHWHWDHIGDPSTFPKSTALVVGPGFKTKFGAGYPTIPDSPVCEAYWSGRDLNEIDFSDDKFGLTIGPFRAYDFFGDGSFYLLDTPGHATGHLAGLARTTTSPETFIFMGGDLCHHGAEIRPSSLVPYPNDFDSAFLRDFKARLPQCPGATQQLTQLHTKYGRKANEPLFEPALGEDVSLAISTIKKAQIADAEPNVLFMFAHDPVFHKHGDLYPQSANDWKSQELKDKVFWAHLEDMIPALGRL